MREWAGFLIALAFSPIVVVADVLADRKHRRILTEYDARRYARYEGE